MSGKNKFIKNKFYYKMGEMPSGEKFISTYIYLGYEKNPEKSTTSCDNPFCFFVFEEYESWIDRKMFGEKKSRKLHIPSLLQANVSMLAWDELISQIHE